MKINWKKVKPNEIYKVEWLDIASHTNEHIKEPYTKNCCLSFTTGHIRKDRDTVIVIYPPLDS